MTTREIGTDNTSFFIDKLGEECSPTQQLREFVQNACEAIQRVQASAPDHVGRILLDHEPYWTNKCRAPKLSISDNGDGMSADDLQRYMNNLFASGSTQAVDRNFGVGAKISSLALNPHGVIFESWKDGTGHMIHMWRDPVSQRYGLKLLFDGEENQSFVLPLAESAIPKTVDTHGTRVVLLGRSDESNTCLAPDGELAKTEWLVKSLNRRYFQFPKSITIMARTGPADGLDDKSHGMRSVHGQGHVLNVCAVSKGSVALRGALARWWLMPAGNDWPQNTKAGWNRSYEATGHVAVMVGTELYLHRLCRDGSRGRAALQEFGVTAGTSQVVIYVEPANINVNLARTAPIFDGHEPPWAEWGAEFRERLPPELAAFVEEIHSKADSSASEEIHKRLASMMDLFAPPRFRRSSTGVRKMDPDTLTEGGAGDIFVPPPERSQKPRPHFKPGGSHAGGRGSSLSDRVKSLGPPATEVFPKNIPRVEWHDQPEIGDFAAEYVRTTNLINVNRSFRVFVQIAEKLEAEYAGRPGASQVIRHQIESWFGQQLVEAVLGVQSLASTQSAEWDARTIEEMTAPPALTVAVCVRCLAINQIRNIASKILGRAVEVEAN